MQSRCFSSTSTRLSYYAAGKKAKKKHWADEIRQLKNTQRALMHYDDFYASVFGKQWPSLRLGLLSPPKYVAIPNPFTGNIESISRKLQDMGTYNVQTLWIEQQSSLDKEKREIDLQKDLGRLHQLDLTLGSIAATKKAEEMDVLYQNAPTSKREEMRLGRAPNQSRVISDMAEASGEFVPSTKLKGVDDFTFDSEYFASYLKQHETPEDLLSENNKDTLREIQFLKSPVNTIEFPKLLVPHIFENGSALMFPPAARDSASGHREYICINGASIIPVMALDLRPGNNLLDLCAGPGTKSLVSLMTMAVDSITCNDVETSRLRRVERILEEFTGTRNLSNVIYTKINARDYPARAEFSRVLADVPCLNDRISCTSSDNNIFTPRRTKERLSLVKIQREILLSGFLALDKNEGSAIVYSTCTLSPIENDGVVMNALKETEVPDLYIDLIGLVKLITPFEKFGMFRIMRTRCGILVLPNTICNFGPMYISRIVVKPSNLSIDNNDNPPSNSSTETEIESQHERT